MNRKSLVAILAIVVISSLIILSIGIIKENKKDPDEVPVIAETASAADGAMAQKEEFLSALLAEGKFEITAEPGIVWSWRKVGAGKGVYQGEEFFWIAGIVERGGQEKLDFLLFRLFELAALNIDQEQWDSSVLCTQYTRIKTAIVVPKGKPWLALEEAVRKISDTGLFSSFELCLLSVENSSLAEA